MDEDGLVLPDPVGAVHRMALDGRVKPRVAKDHRVRLGRRQRDAARLEAEQDDRRIAAGGEVRPASRGYRLQRPSSMRMVLTPDF